MKRFLVWMLACVLVPLAASCHAKSEIFDVSTAEDTLEIVASTSDSIITRVDTILIGGDTTLVVRVDTVFLPHDTIVKIDTLIFTYTDTVVVHDTVYVADTTVVPASTLNFSVTSLVVEVGKTKTVSVSLKNYLGQTIPAGAITWSTDNATIATVAAGVVTGVKAGQTIIRASTTAGTSASLPVDVRDPAPVATGQYRQNMPAGLTTISDYGFNDDLAPHTGFYEGPLGSGWYGVDWGCGGCAIRRIADATSPGSPGFVLEEVYPPHLSGGGPSSFYRAMPATDTFYMSWVVKWDAGFDHNSNSEKMVYFSPNASNYFLFQFHWGSEAMYHVTQADGDGSLRANQMPTDGTGWHLAPPVDGQWVEYEFLFEQSTGRIRWWRDGVLHADHTGRSFPRVDRVKVSTTWGGGGDKQGTHSRYTDHIFIAGN